MENNIGIENFLPKILRNYVNLAKMESDLPRGFSAPKPVEIPISKFSRRFSLKTKKEAENLGLIDFSNLLSAENTPKMNENENLVAQNVSKEGVVTRYEYYGPPIDDPSIVNLAGGDRRTLGSASTSGCCSCRGDENFDHQNHESCDLKYAVLEQEISKLKAQIAQLSKTGSSSVAPPKAPAPPPPPPPPPPLNFLSMTKTALKFSSSSSSARSSQSSSPGLKRRGSFGSGSQEEENFRKQLVNVLKDLENGRAALKPVQKSPGGTPRKRTLESRRKNAQSSTSSTKNCHDLLAEALKAKFANVHRRSSTGAAGNGAYFSDGEANDSSWMEGGADTPTPKKPNKAPNSLSTEQSSPTGFNRSRIHTFS